MICYVLFCYVMYYVRMHAFMHVCMHACVYIRLQEEPANKISQGLPGTAMLFLTLGSQETEGNCSATMISSIMFHVAILPYS